jgi:hypothetical protein
VPAEPLIPKKQLFQQQLTIGRTTQTAAAPRLTTSAPCIAGWHPVTSLNASSGRNILAGLAAGAPNDVWAVGFYVNSSSVYQTLAEHWDGSAWGIVPTPNVGLGNNLLTAITAIGPTDVWAVGFWRPGDSSTYAQPLTEHWNGNGWTVVPTPNVPNSLAPLYGVSAGATNDVWAVGLAEDFPVQPTGPRGHALALHWNGSNWSTVPTASVVAPIAGPGIDLMGLNAVKVLGPNNAWAVGNGQDFTGNSPSSVDMAFIEHWDGIAWSQVTAMPVHVNGDFLIDVQGTASDLWAVGGKNQSYGSKEDYVMIEHWTSLTNTWTDVFGWTPEQSANLLGLGYIAGNNIYAVGASGSFDPITNAETDHTLIEQWDGANWNVVMSMNVGTSDALTAIAAISASDVWAAGFSVVNQYPQTLIENYCAPPVVTSVRPSSGNAGTSVVITGSRFSRAIDVEFGATPAFNFHVDSDTQITAVSPGHKAGMVDITVTVQGTSATSSADQFTYQGSISVAPPGSGTFQNRMSPPPPVRGLPLRPGSLTRAEVVPRAAPSTVSLVPGSPNGDLLSRVAIGVAVTMLELML